MKDASEFWQAVQDTACLIEGENRAFEREHIKALGRGLSEYLDGPEGGREPRFDYFAMSAVSRLVNAFNFNDEIAADAPDGQATDKLATTSG
jgi:hypothetical protein